MIKAKEKETEREFKYDESGELLFDEEEWICYDKGFQDGIKSMITEQKPKTMYEQGLRDGRLAVIKEIKKEHQKIHKEEDGEVWSDCQIIENQIIRVAPRKDWLGDDESWKKSMREQKEMDKNVKCYFCDFLENKKKEWEGFKKK